MAAFPPIAAPCQRDSMTDLEHYSSRAFERAGEKRRDADWIAGKLADDDTPVLDNDELAEASWFTREQLRAPELDIELPSHDSIARRLIDAWIDTG